jgi:hypothetical protein
LPHFDVHCPLLSLPLAFATELETIPADIPYIAIAEDDVAAWRQHLPRQRPRVRLAWSGQRSHDNDLNRSIPLATLLPLLDLAEVNFVSLQHKVRETDAAVLHSHPRLFRIDRKISRFRRDCSGSVLSRCGYLGRQRGCASRGGDGQAASAAAVRRGLPLAARAAG